MESRPKTILLVEDDAELCESIADSLQDEGYQVVSAADGQEALDWLVSSSAMPQVIITDLLMPRLNGWQLCERLGAQNQWKSIPVCVLSTALYDRPWPAGARPLHQLRKPPDLNFLLDLLQTLTPPAAMPAQHQVK